MPPVSPDAKGFLPNSRNEFCPEKPCQPSLVTHGGSRRPVDRAAAQVVWPVPWSVVQVGPLEPPVIGPLFRDCPSQSAPVQYTAPGTRSAVGCEMASKVLAM